jgi:hypothetical protein
VATAAVGDRQPACGDSERASASRTPLGTSGGRALTNRDRALVFELLLAAVAGSEMSAEAERARRRARPIIGRAKQMAHSLFAVKAIVLCP